MVMITSLVPGSGLSAMDLLKTGSNLSGSKLQTGSELLQPAGALSSTLSRRPYR